MTYAARSGPAHVLASGEVTSFFGHPLRWRLDLDEGPFDVEMSFRTDAAAPGVAVHTEAPSAPDAPLRIVVVNADAADGRGTSDPALLGQLGDDLLFLHFRAFRFGATRDHTVHFTFYRAAAADLGWQAHTPRSHDG